MKLWAKQNMSESLKLDLTDNNEDETSNNLPLWALYLHKQIKPNVTQNESVWSKKYVKHSQN